MPLEMYLEMSYQCGDFDALRNAYFLILIVVEELSKIR